MNLVKQVCLWDYQKGVLLARASAQAEIMAATFAADGSIASAGKDHLKVRVKEKRRKERIRKGGKGKEKRKRRDCASQ